MKPEEVKTDLEYDADGNLTVQTTENLLERITQKDANALADLYDAHAGLLMSVIMNVLKNKAEAEDILQDSFIAIYNKADMYSSHLGKPTSWMTTIARNKAYDRYRKLVRQNKGLEGIREDVATFQPVVNDSPQTDNEKLLAGVNELNVDQRRAIELVFFEGLTQSEAAEKLQTPLGTVKARIRRGLLKLKSRITRT